MDMIRTLTKPEDIIIYPDSQKLKEYHEIYKKLKLLSIPLSDNDKKKEGKAPIINNWTKLTLNDTIDFTMAKNIGIVCGEVSGIVCIDIDTNDKGVEYFNLLKNKYTMPDNIPYQITGNNGLHFIFKYENNISTIKSTSKCVKLHKKNGEILSLGIDIKTNGGQFVSYPSVNRITDKEYKWIVFPTNKNIISMPIWLVDLFIKGNINEELEIFSIIPKPITPLNNIMQSNNVLKRRTYTNTDETYLLKLLDALPENEFQSYDNWLEKGMIIYNFYEGNNDKTFDVWCLYSEKYNIDIFVNENSHCAYDPTEICKKINSFKIDDKNNVGLTKLEEKVKLLNPIEYEKIHTKLVNENNCEINENDNFCWVDFDRKYRGCSNVFPCYKALVKCVTNDIKKVFARIELKSALVIKKDDCYDNLHSMVKTNVKYTDLYFSYKNDNEIIDITFQKFIQKNADKIPMYNNIVCKPNSADIRQNEFNLWRGYKAKLLDNPNYNIIQPMLLFLKEIWCNNNEHVYNYLLTWLYYLLIKPEMRTNVSIFCSSKQGCGKNTFTDFLFKYVIGNYLYFETAGIDGLLQKHNKALIGKKLIVVDEMGSSKDEFRSNFDKLKNFITSEYIKIEPKYMDTFMVDNLMNLIIFSNHIDSMLMEIKDRRYLCLDLSENHIQDILYFTNLRNSCFNQLCGDTFYTYFYNYDINNLMSINSPPITTLKEEIIELSRHPVSRFIEHLHTVINNDNIHNFKNIYKCLFIEIYNEYKSWCNIYGEKSIIQYNRFGVYIKQYFNKSDIKIIDGYKYYDLTKIKI